MELIAEPILDLESSANATSVLTAAHDWWNNTDVNLDVHMNCSRTFCPTDNFTNGTCVECLPDDVGNKYNLPWWNELIWYVVFMGMVIVATGGNTIVIWIVLADQRMRTVTNIFLVNLSVADAMVSTLNVVFNFTYMLNLNWRFGFVYCKISQFVSILSICASVFTLMAISFDRYIAIMHPLRPRMGRKATILIVVWIWVSSVCLSLPNLIYFTTATLSYAGGERIVCYAAWPDGDQGESQSEYVHTVVLMVLTYILPLTCMGFTYVRIGLTLWGSRSIGEQTPRQVESIKSKRKVVKMMIVVVTIFAVCWLPYHMYFILSNLMPEIAHYEFIQETYLAIYWLAMSNSMYNPMIYCWLNNRFRNGFKKVFSGWLPCVTYEGEATDVSRVKTARFSCSGSPETHHRVTCDGSSHISMRNLASSDLSISGSRLPPVRLCNGANIRRATNGADTSRSYGGTLVPPKHTPYPSVTYQQYV
ncbi:tachykinin-like peptides receptor 99D isoform X1 [Portunus trituberculatus]|nr:tachykinin-like peptides receptor 99D isoform X1 [Portunus trituberculatus]